VTRAALREYAAAQRERYRRAGRREKHRLLDEIVAVTRLHRKAAIRLLRRPLGPGAARPRSGRPRVYGPPVTAAAQVLWEAAGHIGAPRLQPFVPDLLDRLTRYGELVLPPTVDKLLRQASAATLGRTIVAGVLHPGRAAMRPGSGAAPIPPPVPPPRA
jgi:hypothetical protein